MTYDIASLMRDAFISWEEDFVIDITVRYWEKARKAGLIGAASASGWGADFGEFYRAVDFMALQRHLKVAGIFARLTLRDGKPKYLADAPRFIAYIRATCAAATASWRRCCAWSMNWRARRPPWATPSGGSKMPRIGCLLPLAGLCMHPSF